MKLSEFILGLLWGLSDEKRVEVLDEVFSKFCRYCGTKEFGDGCQCRNDE